MRCVGLGSWSLYLFASATPKIVCSHVKEKAKIPPLFVHEEENFANECDDAVEVLAILLGESPAVCTVFPGLARDDDVTSSGWPGEAWLSSPVDDRCCIKETTPLLILASTWNQRRVTSVPVIASEPLNPRAVSYHGSGLVSSREGNMLSNPLCLAIQVLAILLGESPAVCTVFPGLARDDDVTSSGWPGEAWLSSPVDDRCCIKETTPFSS
ncbi:hypothetical protein HPB51_018870 [Rhipicephalus microplus]|uniref:Secreted protein n=1 Tax=Rhipicephalus microplus TaxID=6941 RepID=A0A9J6DPQ0_RHIMP|nr:hypothetical protein HPB51_018870 [Rhipicephalus microplus]